MMTFGEINTAIQEEMQLDPGLVSDAERQRFINDFLNRVGNLHLLEKVYTQSGVSSQFLDLPTDLVKLKKLYWYDGITYYLCQAVEDTAPFDSTGVPQGYNLEGDQIRLYPYPTSEGTLRWVYNYSPAEYTTGGLGSTPDIPKTWDGLIVDYACYRSHRKNGNQLASLQYLRDFKENLATAINSYRAFLNSKKHVQTGMNTSVASPDSLMAVWGDLDG